MNFLDKLIGNLTKRTVSVKIDDLTSKMKGNKAEDLVEYDDGTYGVIFEDGKEIDGDRFVIEELARQRNRDIDVQRALLGLGAFYITGKTFKLVEKVVKL